MALFSFCSCRRVFMVFFAVVLGFLACLTYLFYTLVAAPTCDPNPPERCLVPAYQQDTKLRLWVFYSKNKEVGVVKNGSLLKVADLDRSNSFTEHINVTLPSEVKNNGSLFAFIFIGPKEKSPLHFTDQRYFSKLSVPLTKYRVPSAATFNLVTGKYDTPESVGEVPVTHWISTLEIHCVADDWKFDRQRIPHDLLLSKILIATDNSYTRYFPLLYVNELCVLDSLLQVTKDNPTMPLTISYSPIGLFQLHMWIHWRRQMELMHTYGIQFKGIEDFWERRFCNSIYFLNLVGFISCVHLLFYGLAFKNDIIFWRNKRTMVGLSASTVLWRCFNCSVVFLYLMEEDASWLALIPAGIAAIIEFWKVGKVLRLQLKWSGCIPTITFGKPLKEEATTLNYDSQAMYYLSFLLVPLVLAGAVYCLLYLSYKSWYSWLIYSLMNGVYAFEFLFMFPQLFVNYKLKSVAHLPWRAFMYKASNTFIDDVFVFVITMPTSQRIAVFRDDLVFLVYLYQRWLYPVDKSRVNEFDEESFEVKEHQD